MRARAALGAWFVTLATTAHGATPATPYLAAGAMPSGAGVLSPPPIAGSMAATLDWQAFFDSRTLKQQDPARWAHIIDDPDPRASPRMSDFDCALGVTLDRKAMPSLQRLLDRTAATMQPSINAAQQHFARARPYLHNHQPICVPRFTRLDRSPSYPSGTAATDWSAALILAELVPDRAERILARGRALGERGIVCGVQWLSDVQAATLFAAGQIAVLHADPKFQADLAQARREIEIARADTTTAHPDVATCEFEMAATTRALSSLP